MTHHREVTHRLSAAPVVLGSLLILVLVWAIVLFGMDDAVAQLSAVSASIRSFGNAGDAGMLIAGGIGASALCTISSSLLLVRSPSTFLAVWLFTLAFAEAQIPVLAPISLAARYSMMVSLIAAGSAGLFLNKRRDPVQWAALALLGVTGIQFMINPVDTNAQLMLPMQMAMFVGVFWGLYPLACNNDAFPGLIEKLAISGIVITGTNLASFAGAEHVFLGGRFRSWYPLPTNFSNSFVLCAVPVFWAMLTARSKALRLTCALAGAGAICMLVFAGTRNALLIVALTMLQFSYFWQRRYFIYVAAGVLLMALAAVALQVGLTDIAPAGSRVAHIDDKETRYAVWERAWRYIQEKPVAGYGLSTDLATLDRFLPSWEQFNAHNAFLGLWLRLGAIGFALYLYIYCRSLKAGWTNILKVRRTRLRSPLLVLFQCLLLDLFIAGLFEENLSSRASIHQAVWALAVIIVLGQARQVRLARFRLHRQPPAGVAYNIAHPQTGFAKESSS